MKGYLDDPYKFTSSQHHTSYGWIHYLMSHIRQQGVVSRQRETPGALKS